MMVWANGQKLTTFKDTERPSLVGAFGVYNEHAQETFFDDVKVTAP